MAFVNHAIHRLLHLPLSAEDVQTESRIIQHIADRNGLRADVPLMIRRKRLCILLSEPGGPDTHLSSRSRWIRLPYLGNLSGSLACELQKLNYRVGFYPLSTIRQLHNLKDPISKRKQSGIYRLVPSLVCWANEPFTLQTPRETPLRLPKVKHHGLSHG